MSRFKTITTNELLEILEKYDHKELHVHHTWRPDHSSLNYSTPLELQESMWRYHTQTRGWSDIGQHLTLLPDGSWITGRDFGRSPASISGYNSGSFAVEMLGNFDIGNDKFEGKQKLSMLRLAKYFNDKGRYIRFHRENASKSCPGTSIYKDAFMRDVDNLGRMVDFMIELTKWQQENACKAIDSLHEKELIDSPEEWKNIVMNEPEKVIEEFPWLIWILIDRLAK